MFALFGVLDNVEKIEINILMMNNSIDLYNSAGVHIESGDIKKGMELYKLSAEQGYSKAMMQLAFIYEKGEIVQQDRNKSKFWHTKAAETGDRDAQYNLGDMYVNGILFEQDDVKAFNWYSQAADQGQVDAQFLVGKMFHEGKGVNQDLNLAREYYSLAAQQGDQEASKAMADIDNQSVSEKLGETDIDTFLNLLHGHNNPLIEGNQNSLEQYINFIKTLPPDFKGYDLGVCVSILASVTRSEVENEHKETLEEIFLQTKWRAMAHVIHLGRLNGIKIKESFKMPKDLHQELIKASIEVVDNFPNNIPYTLNPDDDFSRHKEIGLKMVEKISHNIFD